MEPVNWHSVFFYLFALLTCGLGIAVVVSANVVRMAFYLVLSLAAVAGLFFLAGADFLGAVQILVYVGGTMVLLVFGVMLTARGPFVSMQTGGGQWVLAAVVGGALLAILLQTAFRVHTWHAADGHIASAPPAATTAVDPTATQLGLSLLGVRTEKMAETDDTLANGLAGYLLPFEIISVHLLVVLIGAAYLARARRRTAGPAVSNDTIPTTD
jgi:NADH-quinone oxidoreductase subunit J